MTASEFLAGITLGAAVQVVTWNEAQSHQQNKPRLAALLGGVNITFHQSWLNSNVTAITANLLLGSWNKVIWAFSVSIRFIENGQNKPNVPKLGRIGGSNRFCRGFLGEFGEFQTCKTCLKQVNPCFEVGILLENLFNLANASPWARAVLCRFQNWERPCMAVIQ